MADITVDGTPMGDGWRFSVTVAEGGSRTRHEVTLDRATYQRLTRGRVPPEALVRASFAFLLEREPKEAILGSFDLPTVGRYFPAYEGQIARQLQV